MVNESRRFVTFVANRVAVIREGSSPSQWRHVRSEDNPADYTSIGLKASETEKLEIWRCGPNFLWKDPNKWPQQPIELNIQLSNQDEGVKREKITVSTSALEENFWNVMFGRYSTWEKLRRLVALLIWALHSFQQLRMTQKSWTIYLLCWSQRFPKPPYVRNVRHQTYPKEYCNLESSKGPLSKLKPFMKERLLQVGGRLNRSDFDYNAKHPMILPGKHRITEMIILYYHLANGHVGPHQVLAKTRQRF